MGNYNKRFRYYAFHGARIGGPLVRNWAQNKLKEYALKGSARVAKAALNTWRSRAQQKVKARTVRRREITYNMREGDGSSRSKSALVRKGPKLSKFLMKRASRMTITSDATATLESPLGKQEASTVSFTHLPVQMKAVWDQFVTDYGSDVVNASSKILWNYALQQIEIKNNCNNMAKVKIYDCIARDEDASSPASDWISSHAEDVDATPLDDVKFKDKWNVYKVTRINIPAGAVHYHTRVVKWNKLLDKWQFCDDGTTADSNPIANLTTATMVVHYGGLVDNDGGGSNVVSTGPCKLICRVRTTHEGKILPYSGNIKVQQSTLSSSMEDPKFINEDTDAKVTYEDA